MNKDELLEIIDEEIIMAGKELSNAIENHQIEYWKNRERLLKEIHLIIEQYFVLKEILKTLGE